MADLPIGNEGNLTGATAVTVVAAPASGKQRILPANGLSFYNADSVVHDFIVQKNKNSTITIVWKQAAVAAAAVVLVAKKVTLDATDESLEAKIEGAHTTTAPTFDVSAGETD